MESKAEIARLRARWSKAQLDAVNRALATGTLDRRAFGVTEADGKSFLDLRGITITAHLETPLRGLDLSYCIVIEAATLMTRLRQCRLIGAELPTDVGDHVVGCDFSGANLRRAVLFGRFERCRFTRANLWKADGVDVQFARCDFSGAVLTKATLYGSTFDHCVWDGATFGGGSVGGSQFHGTRPSDKALGDTILEDDDDDDE